MQVFDTVDALNEILSLLDTVPDEYLTQVEREIYTIAETALDDYYTND